MKLYSDFAAHRTRQIAADLIAVCAIALCVWLGISLFRLVERLSGFGVDLAKAGDGLRRTMTAAGKNLGGVPFIGHSIRAPFDGASSAGRTLESAGQSQQDAISQLAIWLGMGIASIPIMLILLIWLMPRIRFARRASAVNRSLRSEAGIELLALRALANRSLSELTALDPDPMRAWRRGDERVMHGLARLELRASGVRLDR